MVEFDSRRAKRDCNVILGWWKAKLASRINASVAPGAFTTKADQSRKVVSEMYNLSGVTFFTGHSLNINYRNFLRRVAYP